MRDLEEKKGGIYKFVLLSIIIIGLCPFTHLDWTLRGTHAVNFERTFLRHLLERLELRRPVVSQQTLLQCHSGQIRWRRYDNWIGTTVGRKKTKVN